MIGMEHIGITEEQLNAIGKAWTKKAGEVRWYVNGWQALIGMEVQYHRSGNVSDVFWTVDGERTNPSNNWYSKYVASTKVWLDAQGRVHVDRCESRCVEEAVVEALDRIVERMVAPAQETSIEAVPEEAVEGMVAWAVPEPAEEEAETEYWLDVESDGEDSFGLFAGAVSTLGPYASEDEARARAEAYGGRWKVWSRVAADGSVVTEVCAQAEAQAPVEEAEVEPEQVAVFVGREDGQQAKVMVPDVGEDVWTCILKAYPTAYDLMDEGRVLVDDGAGYEWDESFVPGEDEALAQWLAQGVQHYSGGLDDSDATIEADRREGMAVVTWDGEDGPVSQAINLNEGDMERIVLGADPVAEGWEDGIGRAVCKANASREGGQ